MPIMDIYISSVVMGIALAATTRLKMTLPFLILGLAIHFGWGQVHPAAGAEWLGSWPAIITFGIAVILEIIADNVPAVDHILDVSEAFVAPVAGALITLAASGMADFDPLLTTVLALVGAGVGAGAYWAHNPVKRGTVDAMGAQLSGASMASSLSETVLATVESVVATFWPVIAIVLIVFSVIGGLVMFVFFKKRPRLLAMLSGILALVVWAISCVPGLGFVAWFTLVWSIAGLALSFKAEKSLLPGLINGAVMLLSAFRLAFTGGLF